MPLKARNWPLSAIILMVAGLLLAGMGFYFVVLRPALLPEDIRFMAITPAQLDPIRPQLETWLGHVFRVMGGYIIATGLLAITLAATSFRQHSLAAAVGVLAGGAVSIGWMSMVNFMIASDFKWVLLAMALVWAASLGAFGWEWRRRGATVPAALAAKNRVAGV
jgi:hypothetical protein